MVLITAIHTIYKNKGATGYFNNVYELIRGNKWMFTKVRAPTVKWTYINKSLKLVCWWVLKKQLMEKMIDEGKKPKFIHNNSNHKII